ncbi:MAG: efflux RND transporter periplasmic adaptor subunit [Pseudomonadota bacterium]
MSDTNDLSDSDAKTGLRAWLMAGMVALAVIGTGATAVQSLYARGAEKETVAARPPLTVAVETARLVDHYTVRERFVGRIEPTRETAPAAERAGLLVEMLVEEGDRVAPGQALARLDTRPLSLARARLLAERDGIDADIELAERTSDRRARLVGDGWASGQAFDEARYSVSGLQARRAALAAEIGEIDLDIEKSTITAPFAGRITARLADEGAVLAAGTALLTLEEIDRPRARIGIPADRAAALAVAQEVRLDAAGAEVTGTVASITRAIDPVTRTVPVLIDLAPDPVLTMGEVVRLSLERAIPARGAWVALTALKEAERGLWSLMIVTEAGVIGREAVELLHVQGDRAFVRGTFADGARVVADGGHRISAGQPVRVAGEG